MRFFCGVATSGSGKVLQVSEEHENQHRCARELLPRRKVGGQAKASPDAAAKEVLHLPALPKELFSDVKQLLSIVDAYTVPMVGSLALMLYIPAVDTHSNAQSPRSLTWELALSRYWSSLIAAPAQLSMWWCQPKAPLLPGPKR